MPFLKLGKQSRVRLEESADVLAILRDVRARLRIVQSHNAGLLGLVSTMNTESAHQRYAIEAVTGALHQQAEQDGQRWERITDWWDMLHPRPETDPVARGRLAFAAYGEHAGWLSHDGATIPGWDELSEDTRTHWIAAARALDTDR